MEISNKTVPISESALLDIIIMTSGYYYFWLLFRKIRAGSITPFFRLRNALWK
jgi:hypothetical protein